MTRRPAARPSPRRRTPNEPPPARDLDGMLKRLHLPTVRQLYADLATRAEADGMAYRMYLETLVAEEIAHRAETRVTRAVRKAQFPFLRTIEDFNFTFQSALRLQMLGSCLGPRAGKRGAERPAERPEWHGQDASLHRHRLSRDPAWVRGALCQRRHLDRPPVAHCPHAAIVYDLFHVVAKYGREVVDRVRVDETNRIARANGPNDTRTRAARRVIKGTRWLLLKNRANVRRRVDRVRLKELLAANRALFITYVLKDDLKQLWRFRYPKAALRWWRSWYRRACASRLGPLIKFARLLAGNLAGILAHCRYPPHTGLVEGINNKIKVLKRMAYGFRDDAYFFLRIRAASPGNS